MGISQLPPELPKELEEAQKLYETYRCDPKKNWLLRKEKHYHSSPKTYSTYKGLINKKFIEDRWSSNKFVDFILEFIKSGGGIQNIRQCNNEKIEYWVRHDIKKVEKLKDFLLRPFEPNFNLDIWIDEINKDFWGMGIGTFSAYLNRINRQKYPVLNGNTVKALDKLKLSKNKNSYKKLINFTDKLLEWYPNTIDRKSVV